MGNRAQSLAVLASRCAAVWGCRQCCSPLGGTQISVRERNESRDGKNPGQQEGPLCPPPAGRVPSPLPRAAPPSLCPGLGAWPSMEGSTLGGMKDEACGQWRSAKPGKSCFRRLQLSARSSERPKAAGHSARLPWHTRPGSPVKQGQRAGCGCREMECAGPRHGAGPFGAGGSCTELLSVCPRGQQELGRRGASKAAQECVCVCVCLWAGHVPWASGPSDSVRLSGEGCLGWQVAGSLERLGGDRGLGGTEELGWAPEEAGGPSYQLPRPWVGAGPRYRQ